MAKKKLQLSELKVKSFVTVVDPAEQRTAKGGYVRVVSAYNYIRDIGGIVHWTSEKTLVSATDTPTAVGVTGGGSSNNSFSSFGPKPV